jgi:hypothetical protein
LCPDSTTLTCLKLFGWVMTIARGSVLAPPIAVTKLKKALSVGTSTFELPSWLITASSMPRVSRRALNVVMDVSWPALAVWAAYDEIAPRRDVQSGEDWAAAPANVYHLMTHKSSTGQTYSFRSRLYCDCQDNHKDDDVRKCTTRQGASSYTCTRDSRIHAQS